MFQLAMPHQTCAQSVATRLALLAALVQALPAADQPFLLPPGATAGTETAAGAIPLAANDPAAQQATKDNSVAKPAAKPGLKLINAGLSQTVPARGQVYSSVDGFPGMWHDEKIDAKGLVTEGGGFRHHGNAPDFWNCTFLEPAFMVTFPDGQNLAPWSYQQVYLGGAYASGEQAGQTLMVFGLVTQAFDHAKDVAKVRLVYRQYAGKDGWLRLSMRLMGGATFERLSVRYNPNLAGRDERIWFNGAVIESVPTARFDFVERKPLDPKKAGVVWYATGKTSTNLAGFGVFSPKYSPAYSVGSAGGAHTSVVTATGTSEFRWMARQTETFGEPAKELAAFAKQLPELRTSLENTSLLLPQTANGVLLDDEARGIIDRLLADAATLGETGPAAASLKAAVTDYDKLGAALRTASSEDKKLDLEVDLVQARARIELVLVPLSERWVAAGGGGGEARGRQACGQACGQTCSQACSQAHRPGDHPLRRALRD